MKKYNYLVFLFILLFSLASTTFLSAQEKRSKRLSPPASVSAILTGWALQIDYSSPGVKGREIWGNLVPYNEVWRTGANEATTIEVSKDVLIRDFRLAAGKYALFTIPSENEWTLIFNTEPGQWGAYSYNPEKDALRVKVNIRKSLEFSEQLKFKIAEKESGTAEVVMKWESLEMIFSVVPANKQLTEKK
ncbi:MAG: DUF2911 domain-containing protein [Bacteroidetes bacterium]|nr:DUF2911 domain-containing protein [Bacteroidota bacterium]